MPHPSNAPEPPANGDSDADDEQFDVWEAMDVLSQETRASVISDVVGHPKEAISVPELLHVNPSLKRSALSQHLQKLVEANILERSELPTGERSRDLPHTFYSVTPEAREFFDRNNIYDVEIWQEQYARVEKPPEIVRIEQMERP